MFYSKHILLDVNFTLTFLLQIPLVICFLFSLRNRLSYGAQIRHNNGNGAPKEFDLQVSSDGSTFTTHQTFVNSANAAGATISFDIIDPVETKYARLLFRNNIAGSESMALGEISFEGNQKL